MGGKKDQGDVARRGIASEFIGHLPAVEARQPKVENDHIRLRSASEFKSGGAVLRLKEIESGECKVGPNNQPECRLVLDQKGHVP